MYLKKLIKRLFMRYNLARAIKEECLDLLRLSDEDISPRISRIDGEIRGKGGVPKSIVESIVLSREEHSENIRKKLQYANVIIAIVDELLSCLDPLECRVIKHIYFSLDDDEEICNEMKIRRQELKIIQIKAIDKVKYKILRHL